MEKIRVMVIDDHPVFREGLSRMLSEQPDMEVVAQAGSAEDALKSARELTPDVAIIDVALPQTDGIELAKQLKFSLPDIKLLMLSAYDYEAYVVSSIRAGASGYLIKDTSPREVENAIRSIHAGEAVFEMKAVSGVLKRLTNNGTVEESGQLHKRELDVLKLAARGETNKEIALQLGISERTVQAHLINAYRKLGVNSRTGALLRALKERWLNLDDLNWRGLDGQVSTAKE